jgi:hypothetical protein
MKTNLMNYKNFLIFVFRKNYICYLLLLFSFVFSILSNLIKDTIDKKTVEYDSLQKTLNVINDLNKNPEKANFILDHLFIGKANNFEDFINKAASNNNGKIISCINIETSLDAGLKKETMIIVGIFWHDAFVFDFLDEITKFNPGFINISKIEIEKIGEVSLDKPVIKVLIKCKIFQK